MHACLALLLLLGGGGCRVGSPLVVSCIGRALSAFSFFDVLNAWLGVDVELHNTC